MESERSRFPPEEELWKNICAVSLEENGKTVVKLGEVRFLPEDEELRAQLQYIGYEDAAALEDAVRLELMKSPTGMGSA